ncbi:unnamed protein product [Parajaminaea phylloscopi]
MVVQTSVHSLITTFEHSAQKHPCVIDRPRARHIRDARTGEAVSSPMSSGPQQTGSSPTSGPQQDSDELANTTQLLASRQQSSALPRIHRASSSLAIPEGEELTVDRAAVQEIQSDNEDEDGTSDAVPDQRKRMTVIVDDEEPDADSESETRGAFDASQVQRTHDLSPEAEPDADDGQAREPDAGPSTASSSTHLTGLASPQRPQTGGTDPYASQQLLHSPTLRTGPDGKSPRQVRTPGLLGLHPARTKSIAIAQSSQGNEQSQAKLPHISAERDRQAGQSESESEGDEEDGEDPEPSLKYQRLKGSIPDILKKDSASAFAVSDKFLALGTHAGMVFIIDFSGNLIKAFRSHTASVLDLSIDSANEFVAAAGMDGLLSISSLDSAEHYAFDFKRPMRAVSLEPAFGRKASRAFACGGMAGALVHREKGWLGHKETVIHAGEGPIWAVRWRRNFIAWANDAGVRIYDTASRTKITFISAPKGQDRVDLFRPNLLWQDDHTLVIAWADQIKFARLKDHRSANEGSKALSATALGQSPVSVTVEVTKIFQMDCAISGLAPYGDQLLVLAYLTEEPSSEEDESVQSEEEDVHISGSKRKANFRRAMGQRPELRLLDPDTGEEKSSDVLSLTGFERLGCNDYHLVPSHRTMSKRQVSSRSNAQSLDDLFYVISPHDVIIARPRDAKDHIHWLLDHKKYEAALDAVDKIGPVAAKDAGFDSKEIGKKYLTHLVDDERDYDAAAEIGVSVLEGDVPGWEEWVFLFLDRGEIERLLPWIPLANPVLPNVTYDIVLARLLKTNPEKLRAVVNAWPHEIYSSAAVALAIEDKLQEERKAEAEQRGAGKSTLLMDILADLYVRSGQPGKGLQYYLQLKRPGVFDLIRDHNLILQVRDQARQLLEFENEVKTDQGETEVVEKDKLDSKGEATKERPSRAIQLLVDHVHSIPPQRVVPQLETLPLQLHRYLSALFHLDPSLVTSYSDLQVSLYARFAPQGLMNYLRSMSSYYSFGNAFSVCERQDLVPEMVFLLGRVGDNKRALNLIIERLGDVERAIDFAKEQNDDDLWEDVFRYSESRPAFIRGLLENVGGVERIDPVQLIRRIQNGLEIPGLRDAVRKILGDYNLQVSLLEGCLDVMDAEGRALAHGRTQAQNQGIALMVAGADVEGKESQTAVVGSGLAMATKCRGCGDKLIKEKGPDRSRFTLSDSAPAASISSAKDGRGATSSRASGLAVVFLCRHAYHLSCLLAEQSIPARRRREATGDAGRDDDLDGDDQSLALGRLTSTVTQIRQRRRWGPGSIANRTSEAGVTASLLDDSNQQWGPAVREASQRRRWQLSQHYASRLRVPVRAKGGCPTCTHKTSPPADDGATEELGA